VSKPKPVNVLPFSRAIDIAKKMFERRAQLMALSGDTYSAGVAPFCEKIVAKMAADGCNEVEACICLATETPSDVNWLTAAALDIRESKRTRALPAAKRGKISTLQQGRGGSVVTGTEA
jgi:hypothetical protein